MRTARLIRALLAAAVVGFLVYYVDPAAMLDAAAGADLRWIAAAVILLPANVALEATVWIFLARRVDPDLTIEEGVGALMAGYALGFFTPARAGDFAGRAFYVRHADKWEITAVVAAQRLLDLAVIIAVGTAMLFLFTSAYDPEPEVLWRALSIGGSVAGTLLVIAGLIPSVTLRVATRLIPFEAVRTRLRFLGRLSPRDGRNVLALNLARFIVYGTQFVFLIRALIPDVGLGAAYVGVGVIFLTKMLIPPITLMDLGIRESVAVLVLGKMGLPEAAALNASILLFATNILLPAIVGLPFVLKMRVPWHDADGVEAPVDPDAPTSNAGVADASDADDGTGSDVTTTRDTKPSP